MKLYILTPIDGRSEWTPWYDKSFGFVVRAKNEEEARLIASQNSADEGFNAWLDPSISTCQELTIKGPSKLIMRDFHAA